MGSKLFRPFRRAATVALAAVVFAAGAAALTATPAMASAVSTLSPSSWAYTDSAAPRTSFVNPKGGAPVGAHTYAGGTNHVSKSYLTFDLSTLRGHRLLSAYLGIAETAVTDCESPRTTELWLTDTAKKPTWNNQPAELVKAGGPYLDSECPSTEVGWNLTAVLQNALDAGRSTATFALRLPDGRQDDPRFGRVYNPSAEISLSYNRAPVKPTQLMVNEKACSGILPLSRSVTLGATVTDPDDGYLSAEFALWPVDQPDQRTTFANTGTGFGGRVSAIADNFLTEGVTYAWQVRGKDYTDFGPWSAICKLRTDFTAPVAVPTVSSTDYTYDYPGTGGTGIPGNFTVSANGDTDVTGFYYGESETTTYVAADRRGGKATFRYTPTSSGPVSLRARSVDAAGNSSPSTDYRFWVVSNEPDVTCTPWEAFVGEPRLCTFTPRGGGVSGYVYQMDGQSEKSVPAGADGTATVTVIPANADITYRLSVRAKLANGYLTSAVDEYIRSEPGVPVIDVPAEQPMMGSPATFTFHSGLPGSVSFTYRWNGGDPVTVPMEADGTATVTVTAGPSGYNSMSVRSTTAAGYSSGSESASITVASNQTRVTSVEYPASQSGGGIGIPGTFVFSSPVPGAVSYTYQLRGVSGTVPAGPDGTASVVYIPTESYVNFVTVTSTFADGSVSEQGGYTFYVSYSYPRVSCDATGSWSVRPGQLIQCGMAPVQANVVSYGYSLDRGAETAVAAGADGKAAISFTVPESKTSGSYLQLYAWSVNTAGVRSEDYSTSFYVQSPTPTVGSIHAV
jgi:hypothetical protein